VKADEFRVKGLTFIILLGRPAIYNINSSEKKTTA